VAILVYRIVKTTWVSSAFDGEGARRYGGRWNSVGTPMVYTSESRSLAALEILVHLEGPARGYSLAACEIPDDVVIESVAATELPADWMISPAPAALAALGDAWIRRGTSAILKVPSAVVDREYNYLLNPRHPSFERMSIHTAVPFNYDERLIGITQRRRP